jgi:hypothetical protein
MGSNIVGYVVFLVLIGVVVAVVYSVSLSKNPCPHCHTIIPRKATRCPHCGKGIVRGY